MRAELFNLNFPGWDIIALSLLPATINFAIFLYTTLFMPQSETTRSFSIFVFLLGLWQAGEGLVKMSQTPEAGLEWNRISTFIIVFVISAGLSFVLDYTKWKKRIPVNLYFFLIFFPAIFCSFLIVARLDMYTIIQSYQWFWVINPVPSVFTGIIYLWAALGGLVVLALLLFHFRSIRESEIKRKRSLLLIVGLSIPIISGITVEIILPFFLKQDNVPITNSLLSVFSVSTLIAIRRYKIFEYSPNYLWGKIKDAMTEGVIIIDNNEKVVFANKVFCKLVGFGFDKIENRNINEFLFGGEETSGMNMAGLGEIRITARDGTKKWVMVSGSPYLDEKGNTIGTILLLANITERVGLEEKLKASNHDLKTFIYRSSHDLRTPLASVLGLMELAKIEITDPKAREYFGYIDSLTKKMDHLLLTLIQVMSVRDHVLKIEDVDPGELLNEIVRSLKYQEGYDLINFTVENHMSERVRTDRMLLHNSVFNLMENALLYRKRDASDPQITVKITEDAKSILIEVIDNGIGIKEEDQKKVFDMFFRATRLSIGSGLGLYMVKTSVDRLGGRVYLESHEGEGTRFTVVLPK